MEFERCPDIAKFKKLSPNYINPNSKLLKMVQLDSLVNIIQLLNKLDQSNRGGISGVSELNPCRTGIHHLRTRIVRSILQEKGSNYRVLLRSDC